jgi:hypothetical protein
MNVSVEDWLATRLARGTRRLSGGLIGDGGRLLADGTRVKDLRDGTLGYFVRRAEQRQHERHERLEAAPDARVAQQMPSFRRQVRAKHAKRG